MHFWKITLFSCFLCLLIFLYSENYGSSNLISKELRKNIFFLNCMFSIFCIATVSNLFFFFAPNFLNGYLQFSSFSLSWLITIDAIIPLIFAIYFGKLSDHSPHLIFVSGICFYFLTLLLYSLSYMNLNLSILSALYVLIGVSSSLLSPSQMKLTLMTIPESLTGHIWEYTILLWCCHNHNFYGIYIRRSF